MIDYNNDQVVFINSLIVFIIVRNIINCMINSSMENFNYLSSVNNIYERLQSTNKLKL